MAGQTSTYSIIAPLGSKRRTETKPYTQTCYRLLVCQCVHLWTYMHLKQLFSHIIKLRTALNHIQIHLPCYLFVLESNADVGSGGDIITLNTRCALYAQLTDTALCLMWDSWQHVHKFRYKPKSKIAFAIHLYVLGAVKQ